MELSPWLTPVTLGCDFCAWCSWEELLGSPAHFTNQKPEANRGRQMPEVLGELGT